MTKRAASLGLSILLGIGSGTISAPASAQGAATKQHPAQGIVLQVDKAHKYLEVSCDQIPDYMDAMDMAFTLRTPADLNVAASLKPGTKIRFTIEEQGKSLYAENVQVESSQVFEPEPMEASGLTALHKALNPSQAATIIGIGQPVPDFSLTDQTGNVIRLSQFQGKVVALTFGYSRCPNPNYCYRLSNNLAHVQRQLREHARKDLVLLTIAIDPEHDKGEVLAQYAAAFRADPEMWHFLTGPAPEIQKIAAYFGMNFWSNEGLLTHSLHTVILDRDGRMVANLEGNQFTPQQLTDLVRSVMNRSR
jgi:protein SCO1/2